MEFNPDPALGVIHRVWHLCLSDFETRAKFIWIITFIFSKKLININIDSPKIRHGNTFSIGSISKRGAKFSPHRYMFNL